jgi:acyl-CoA dehydrogenase
MDDLLSRGLRQLLDARCTPAVVRGIEGGDAPAALWSALEQSGFADALVSEAQGGAGLALADVFELFELCGAHAVPVPLAETILARGLLASAGVERPAGSIALAHAHSVVDGAIRGTNVPGGWVADWVLVQRPDDCLLLPVAQAASTPAVFPLDATLEWTASAVAAAKRAAGTHDVQALQACAGAAQLAGALMSVFARTLRYANERVQFGRPIGKFQAIQHQLAVLSEHAFAARMAAQIGCHAHGCVPDRLRVAVAKARTSEAAVEVAALAHAIHGAIGFTAEYDLQLFTRRLHAWRQAAGSESYWHDVLGRHAVDEHQGLALDVLRATTDLH